MILRAHGVGSRTDLAHPPRLALYGAGAAIRISFAVLLSWRTPRLGGTSSGRPLPSALQRVAGSAAVRRGPQVAALAGAALVTAVAIAGPPDTDRDLAPWVLYVTFWVGPTHPRTGERRRRSATARPSAGRWDSASTGANGVRCPA